jgi:predicted helicase
MVWNKLTPNDEGDWVSQRNDSYNAYIPLAPDKKFDESTQSMFVTNAIGIATNRDAWVYNSSAVTLGKNMKSFTSFYNAQVKKCKGSEDIEKCLDYDTSKISWTVNLKKDAKQAKLKKIQKGGCDYFKLQTFLQASVLF